MYNDWKGKARNRDSRAESTQIDFYGDLSSAAIMLQNADRASYRLEEEGEW
jgi:hypothetical protein